jgi:uncharacterized protein (DUF427 family)
MPGGYRIEVSLTPRRICAVYKGKCIAESDAVLVLKESGHDPIFYFPRLSVRMGFLERSERTTSCPFKGEASYWTINVAGRRAQNAVWSYEDPLIEVSGIKDYLAFYWDKVDAWYADDKPLASPADVA